MRKFFPSAFLITATLAVIVGVGVAWTSSASGSTAATAGTLSVALDSSAVGYGAIANQVYPSGLDTNVFKGQIKNNTLADPGIAVSLTTGSVSVTGATGGCNTAYITGDVVVTNTGPIAPGGAIGGEWYARLKMATDAPNSCMGSTISYTVIVNVTT